MSEPWRHVRSLQECLLNDKSPWVRLAAANALQNIDDRAKPALAALEKAAKDNNDYVQRAARYTVAVLKGEEPQNPD
ncbi:MAG: HEAT repeat domain-containing protein [bacterium]